MKDHIKIIAWLHIILGVLGIFGALIVSAVIAGGGWISGDDVAIRVTAIVAFVIGGIILLVSVPGIIVGLGLLSFKPWARILAIILSLFNLLGFPVGTALGVYTLWAMLDSETSQLFNPES